MSTAELIETRIGRARAGAVFSIHDFSGSKPAVKSALSRLVAEGKIHRLRRGIYWRGAKSRFGSGRPWPGDVVKKLASDKAVGPTGWSASYELGLSTQVPAVPEFVLLGSLPKNVPGVGFRTRWNLRRIELNYFEVGLLEILRSWPSFAEVSWDELTRKVKELSLRGILRPDRILDVALFEKSPKARKSAEALLKNLISDIPQQNQTDNR